MSYLGIFSTYCSNNATLYRGGRGRGGGSGTKGFLWGICIIPAQHTEPIKKEIPCTDVLSLTALVLVSFVYAWV